MQFWWLPHIGKDSVERIKKTGKDYCSLPRDHGKIGITTLVLKTLDAKKNRKNV